METFFLEDLTTGSQPDLVVHLLVEVQQQSNKVLPILVDENIHYRLCKMMCSKSYAQYNLAFFYLKKTDVGFCTGCGTPISMRLLFATGAFPLCLYS